MTLPSTESQSYSSIAKFLHWLIALAIVGMLALGWIMADMPNNSDKFALFQLHKSIGLSILVLSVLRLVWRLFHRAPPLPPGMPRWEQYAARATHWLFYFLIIFMPLTGWVIVSTSALGLPTMYFGLFSWPHLPLAGLADKKAVNHFFAEMNGFLAYAIVALLALHVLAAGKHHLLNRDDVLTRMAPKLSHKFLNRLRGM